MCFRQEKPFGWVVMYLFSVRKTVGAYRIRPEVREKSAASSVESMCFRQETPFDWDVMNLFSVRRTVGAYRIRPEVREKSAASSVDAAVGLRGSPTWRAYAIRPYTCSIEFFA